MQSLYASILELHVITMGNAIYALMTPNPEKESQEYIDAIKKDVQWLGFRLV